MSKAYARTFQLRHYPRPQVLVECTKCKRQGRFDKAQLIEELGGTYPLFQAVNEVTQDWKCEKFNAMPAYAQHPRAMECFRYLPEWQEPVNQFFLKGNYGRKLGPK
ncbi:hypothetical protein [Microvirga tunisiensis]|uniref:Uncharacterized protein n=1 Tax=Microvirga tunisiensis TaxID=2108360 RepID=A0A5N7MUZ4_9HYPH|nr:hypothetical protein [Microvirga tunisiensis]MPR12357.1 hypothetical protein [Microvirga tunisiensis]MPR30289.1 hypothetical protein [Microvirga tunisiensis]